MKKRVLPLLFVLAMVLFSVPTNVMASDYSAEITFDRSEGGLGNLSVTIADGEEILGNRGLSNEIFPKSYFLGWADSDDFGTTEGVKFYQRETKVSKILPNGTAEGESITLYAIYINPLELDTLNELNTLDLNKYLTGEETVLNTKIKTQPSLIPIANRYTEAYLSGKEYYNIDAKSNFNLNPKIAVAIYNDPWVGALDNGSAWGEQDFKDPHMTYIDLHVKFDPRLDISETITGVFKSYNFRPIYVLSPYYVDGTLVADGEPHPHLAERN